MRALESISTFDDLRFIEITIVYRYCKTKYIKKSAEKYYMQFCIKSNFIFLGLFLFTNGLSVAVTWIQSYLSNGVQYVKFDLKKLTLFPVLSGVPLGQCFYSFTLMIFAMLLYSLNAWCMQTILSSSSRWPRQGTYLICNRI